MKFSHWKIVLFRCVTVDLSVMVVVDW